MRNLKKFLAVILAIAVIATTMVPAFAADATYAAEAEALVELGLVSGGDLDQTLTREQGITIALKLGGYQDEADAITDEEIDEILADVKDADKISSWARGWMAIGVETGIVSGDGNGYVEPDEPFTGAHLATVILKIMNYTVADWKKATVDLANIGGLTPAEILFTDVQLTRDAAFGMMYAALSAEYEDGSTLIEGLIADGLVDEELAIELGLIAPATIVSVEDIVDEVNVGEEYVLPEEVEATFSDDTTAMVAVTWDPAEVDTTTAGEVTVTGTIEGYEDGITATITVNAVPLAVDSITAANYREIVVTFNKAVDKALLEDEGNYALSAGGTVKLATASSDGTSVTLLTASAFPKQTNIDVTTKAALGFAADVKTTMPGIIDTAIPSITNIEVVGNKQIKVTYSEPVKNYLAIGNYKIDNLYFASNIPNISDDEKTFTFNLSNILAAGAHTFTVVANVSDYADYVVPAVAKEFAVATDTTKATVSFVSASQTQLVVKFDKPVVESSITVTSAAGTITTKDLDDADQMTLTVNYNPSNPLPAVGTVVVTFKGVTDFYGNVSDDLTMTVSATPDVTRPEVLDVTAPDQASIVVSFSEPVNLDGTYSLAAADGDPASVAVNQDYAKKADNVTNDTTKVKLTKNGGGNFSAEAYNLSISGVTDINPLKNVALSVIKSVTVPDTTGPSRTSVLKDATNRSLYIAYDQEIDQVAATTRTNYSFIKNDDSVVVSLSADTAVSVLDDGKTVKITFPSTGDNAILVDTIKTLQIIGQKDTAGNAVTSSPVIPRHNGVDGTSWAGLGGAPTMTAAAVTGANTIVATLSGPILDTTKALSDFYVRDVNGNPVNLINIAYDATYNTITLTTNTPETLTADGKLASSGLEVVVYTNSVTNASNVVGQKLVGGTIKPADDGYAPTASYAATTYTGGHTVVKVEFSENIQATGGFGLEDWAQFIVTADGTNVAFTAIYTPASGANKAKIEFTITNATDYTGKAISVKFFKPETATITDMASPANALADFTVSK